MRSAEIRHPAFGAISRAAAHLLSTSRRADTTRAKVVVVDDDPLIRMLLRCTLRSDRLDVLEADDGGAALQLLEKVSPSLVVLDWFLPGRSGSEVLAEIKQRAPSVPVLVLTGAHAHRERERAARLHADVFLTKPFSPLELLQAVERLIGRDGGRDR